MPHHHHTPAFDRASRRDLGVPEYEFEVVSIPREWSRNDVRQMLAERAEYGRWELARTLVLLGGQRKVWLRRRIIRVRRTL